MAGRCVPVQPKIVDSKGGGKIGQLSIDSSLDLTLADLLPKGWDFQKSDGSWLSTTELKGKTGVQCHRGAASHPEHEVSHRDEHDLWRCGDASCQGREGNRHRQL